VPLLLTPVFAIVRARTAQMWDALVGLLVTLADA
jgi:hypothetical protein